MTAKEGCFIVIEGLDGAGLSTQSALLAAYLRSKGNDVLLTKEPTASPIGKLIKGALNRNPELSLFTLQLLFAADRAEHLKREIEPALAAKKIVTSDRAKTSPPWYFVRWITSHSLNSGLMHAFVGLSSHG